MSRELLKNEDGMWMDTVHFETEEDAKAAAEEFSKNSYGRAFEEVIDTSTAKMMHFTVAKKY